MIYSNTRGSINGNFSITFYDMIGVSRTTDPIPYGATCPQVVRAFETLPNNAVAAGTMACLRWTDYNNIPAADEPIVSSPNPYYGIKYTLTFPDNPGTLQSPEVNFNSNDMRSTLRIDPFYNTSKVGAFVYPNGFQGETTDFVPDLCKEVLVGLSTFRGKGSLGTYDFLTGLAPFESRIFKQCLGMADGGVSPPNEVLSVMGESFSWQYGSRYNPHLIKLVDTTSTPMTDLCPGVDNVRGVRTDGKVNEMCSVPATGFYALIIYDPVQEIFKLINKPAQDYSPQTSFSVYTTTGVVQMVSDSAAVYTDPRNPYSSTIFTGPTQGATAINNYKGNIDCESNPTLQNSAQDCVEVNKYLIFVDPSLTSLAYQTNPKYLNIYKVRKASRQWRTATDLLLSGGAPTMLRPEIVLDQAISSAYLLNIQLVRAFTFTPPVDSYTYVSECSGRGICDDTFGLCNCFQGFDLDNCARMTARAPDNT